MIGVTQSHIFSNKTNQDFGHHISVDEWKSSFYASHLRFPFVLYLWLGDRKLWNSFGMKRRVNLSTTPGSHQMNGSHNLPWSLLYKNSITYLTNLDSGAFGNWAHTQWFVHMLQKKKGKEKRKNWNDSFSLHILLV